MTLASATAGRIPSPRRQAREQEPRARRADIDGLRTLAIVLVVVYHVWFGRVSGGVDVFLLVSAYLLTASFLRRADEVGFAFVGRFWVRRFARLMPAAAVVIGAVLALTFLLRPASAWRDVWQQSWASLFYFQNWELAASSVDYYARISAFPSPLQHFWSLSIQGQVFLLWPVLIGVALVVARRIAVDPRRALTIVFAVVFAVSFTWSVVATSFDQQAAYFDTGARLWEFALGSLAALVGPMLRITPRLGAILAWVGFVGLVSCGIVLDVGAAFPGWAALWPTLSALCLLVGGGPLNRSVPSRFLASRAMTRFGRIAYALYLVHWPLLIVYMWLTDSTRVGVVGGVVVIAASIVAAALLHRVERRVEGFNVSPRRAGSVVLASLLVVSLPLAGWQTVERIHARGANPEQNPGAAVLLPYGAAVAVDDAPIVPAGTVLDEEWVALDEGCTSDYRPAGSEARATCAERRAPSGGDRVALVIGDSHAEQWMGALIPITDQAGWNIVSLLKGGCGFGAEHSGENQEECETWESESIDFALDLQPDVVMLMGSRAEVDGPGEYVPANLPSRIDTLVELGTQVLLVRDNPRHSWNVFTCVEENGPLAEECRAAKSDALAPEFPALPLSEAEEVSIADLSDYLCPQDVCEPVIGNVAVYLDDNHLTATYAATLAPALRLIFDELPSFPLP